MGMILNHVKQHKKVLFLALLLATINQVFSLLDPQIFRLIIDNYATKATEIPQNEFLKGVGLLLLGLVGVALVSRIAKNFQDYFVNSITQHVGTSMYAESVDHVFSLPYGIFEDKRSGEILQKLQKARLDTQAIIASSINVLFLSCVGIVFVLIYALFVHWSIALAYFLLIPCLGSVTFVLSRKIRAAQKSIVAESAELAGATTETIRNVELVKSLGLEEQEVKRLNAVNEKILNLELKKIVLIRKLSFMQGTMVNATRTGIMLLMLFHISQGTISLGEFFSLLFYSFFVFAPLGELANVVTQYQEARASNEELGKILKIKSESKPKNARQIAEIDEVAFKGVSFTYNGANIPSVKDITLKIKEGDTVAFVGPSGSGKTTLIKLLVGLYKPKKGNLTVNGIAASKIDFDAMRRKIGFVSQETQLFAGTIKENLLFVHPNATDEECHHALKLASVDHILNRKGNKGLHTKIGEGGIKLSGGERQRLAIARALLRNPDMIIFDEATSSLDSLTEEAITKTIQNIKKHHPKMITVMIAHRLSTIAHADTIYVLEKSKIVEQGTHKKLLTKKGLYAALWRQQSAARE